MDQTQGSPMKGIRYDQNADTKFETLDMMWNKDYAENMNGNTTNAFKKEKRSMEDYDSGSIFNQ